MLRAQEVRGHCRTLAQVSHYFPQYPDQLGRIYADG